MIKLTRTDGQAIVLNEDFIENITQTPDTFICLTSGKTLVVKENLDEIIELIETFHKKCHPTYSEKTVRAPKVKN